ncbi:MAG: protein kinase [Microscillaceae bacterium]|jgi:serine/threonine protein kinase|nr:protein kinase [Microscillaceae bacterium]
MTGEKILNYKIENFTEENSLFRSFLATHTQFSKKVTVKALKTLPEPAEKAELVQDIRRLAMLQHPNIITLYDFYEAGDDFYLVFEHLKGQSLANYIQQVSGPIPAEKARVLMLKILDAFIWAHRHGVMNGAINPHNIWIDEDENIKILDLALNKFYAAKALQNADKETVSFLSPEQIGNKSVNQRADVYALGVVLFMMITGKNPYQGFNLGEIQYKITNETLPPTEQFYPMTSPEMQAIIQKATIKNPADRYQTCEDFRNALAVVKQFTLPNEVKLPETNVETIPIEAKFFNLPLYALLGLTGVLILMLFWYFLPSRSADSEILFDLKNTQRIRFMQDSIAKAQAKKAMEDSVRIFGLTRRDTIENYFHRVSRGENLEKIARRYYTPLDSIKKWNNFRGNVKLKPKDGIKIKIRQIYKVQRNETIEQIGAKFNISPLILKEVNQLYPKPPKPGEEPQPVFFEGKDLVIPWLITPKKK